MEPDWLISYKKRQKERRESQEKSEAQAVQQSIESAAYGRPIAPKFNGGACAVAIPSGTSAGEQGTVTWVAIASSTSPWKAVSTAAQPVEIVRDGENTLTANNVSSARSSPVRRYVTDLCLTIPPPVNFVRLAMMLPAVKQAVVF